MTFQPTLHPALISSKTLVPTNPLLQHEDSARDGFSNLGSGDNTSDARYSLFDLKVNGQGSDDIIHTGSGNDVIYGGSGNDTVYAGMGNDTVYAGSGDDDIYAGRGNDTVYGGAGADLLYGEGGNDRLEGGAGHDQIYGGAGLDDLIGGSGIDYFRVEAGGGMDTVLDFIQGEDRITLLVDLNALKLDGAYHLDLVEGRNLIIGPDAAAVSAEHAAVLFDTTTQILSFDADGSGAGAAVAMAKLEGVTSLSDADFIWRPSPV